VADPKEAQPHQYRAPDLVRLVAELTAQIPDQRRVEEAYRKAGEVSQADLRYDVQLPQQIEWLAQRVREA
jgi:hypothetical protein